MKINKNLKFRNAKLYEPYGYVVTENGETLEWCSTYEKAVEFLKDYVDEFGIELDDMIPNRYADCLDEDGYRTIGYGSYRMSGDREWFDDSVENDYRIFREDHR